MDTEKKLERVLLVDDEANVLESLNRQLRRRFAVTTALGGEAGLEELERGDDFCVVVSDLMMPGMDGITFLSRVRERAPDSVRVLLTGNFDLDSAVAAVNEGSVFRFLTKPCNPTTLDQALTAAAEQHRLITVERTLLERTLHGSIKALTDVLALINPAGFGRATRAKSIVAEFLSFLGLESSWEIEIAAMLSQIGSVTLSAGTVEKLYRGENISYAETLAVAKLPRVASELIKDIPRLEGVREVLASQNLRYDGVESPSRSPKGLDIPWGGRALKIVLDFDVFVTKGMPAPVAIDALRGRKEWYDPELLEKFAEMHAASEPRKEIVQMDLRAVRPGMVFAEDVQTGTGLLLVARGQEASERLIERIRNFAHLDAVQDSVHMIVASKEIASSEKSGENGAAACVPAEDLSASVAPADG